MSTSAAARRRGLRLSGPEIGVRHDAAGFVVWRLDARQRCRSRRRVRNSRQCLHRPGGWIRAMRNSW